MGNSPSTQQQRASKRGGALPSLNDLQKGIIRVPAAVDASAAFKNVSEGVTTWQNGSARRRELHMNGATMREEFKSNQRAYRDNFAANGQAFRENVIPTVEVLGRGVSRYLANQNWMQLFQTFLSTAHLVAHFMEVLQGSNALEELGIKIHGELQAQTGLNAPKQFARQVDKRIRKEAVTSYPGDLPHLFFLYHPDTDWHAEFHSIIQGQALPINFLGMAENLHALCAWMLFLRQNLIKSARKAHFHLLIPSYRPMIIRDPFIFPEELYPLTIHGDIHGSERRIWLNLPTMTDISADQFDLKHVGNIACLPEPPGLWDKTRDKIGNFFNPPGPPPPIVLGRGEGVDPDDNPNVEDFSVQPGTNHVTQKKRQNQRSGRRRQQRQRR